MYEVEESDSVGDETAEETFEIRQKHRRPCQQCLRCVTTVTEEDIRSNDWKSTQILTGRVIKVTRKSTSGAVIMAEGMRLHAHSRGQASVALSSCEAEVMAASEGVKEALLLQEVLMFVGLGHYEIEIKVDSSAAHAFFHRRGVGTHEAHRFENLVASRFDCCGRCEIEEDTENTKLGRHVDAYTKCEGT